MSLRPDWRSLAPRLRDARTRAGLTVEEASVRSGVDRGSLYAYEGGRTEPKAVALLALCNVYALDPRELVAS